MDLYEREAKELLARWDIRVPRGRVANTPGEAARLARELEGAEVAVKAQVRAGGRGKAGLVRVVSQAEVAVAVAGILGARHRGERVEKVLLEEKLDIAQELYAGVIVDTRLGLPLLLLSGRGGVEIEELAAVKPEAVYRETLTRIPPLHRITAAWLAAGYQGPALGEVARATRSLLEMFFASDATMAEINPLVCTVAGAVVAADAKVTVDDAALFRQPWAAGLVRPPEGKMEEMARQYRLAYVSLDVGGDIGIIAGGAGLALATMDMVRAWGGRPANFLDTGGGVSAGQVAAAMRIVHGTPGVRGILVNIFGGINNCLTVAQGIREFMAAEPLVARLVVKMRGHSQEEGWALLEEAGVKVVKYGSTEEAVKLLLAE